MDGDDDDYAPDDHAVDDDEDDDMIIDGVEEEEWNPSDSNAMDIDEEEEKEIKVKHFEGSSDEDEDGFDDEIDESEADSSRKKTKKLKSKKSKNELNYHLDPSAQVTAFHDASKYFKAREQIDKLIQQTLKIHAPLTMAYFETVEDYNRFLEDIELYIYNVANKITEAETLQLLKSRLQKLSNGPALPNFTEEQTLAAKRRHIASSFASLQYKVDLRVKPLMNLAQPQNQGNLDQTLAAAEHARRQLEDAAKWISEEEAFVDRNLEKRKVKAGILQPKPAAIILSSLASKSTSRTQTPSIEAEFGTFPQKKSDIDDSQRATGYSSRLLEERRKKEFSGGLSRIN